MHYKTTNPSQAVVGYIVDQASQHYCYKIAKKEVIGKLVSEEGRNFSLQCSKAVLNLQNIRMHTQIPTLCKEDTLLSPTCHKKKHNFHYTSAFVSPKLLVSSTQRKSSKIRSQRLTMKPKKAKYDSNCLPLKFCQENDYIIDVLREKKAKLNNLQSFFKQNQKIEKIKDKLEKKSKNPFTTDYNGQKIQFKKLSRLSKMPSNYTIEINTKIREQRQFHDCVVIPQNNLDVKSNKENNKNQQFRKTAPLNYNNQSQVSSTSKRFTRESLKLDRLTLREMQKDFKIQQKRQKRSSLPKFKTNTENISINNFVITL